MKAVFVRTVPAVMQHFGCNADDAKRFIDLREEGYSAHMAALMAGLADPPDHEQEEPVDPYGNGLDAALARIEELEREKRELYGRFVGLLEKLHDEEVLSEQQCAKYLGVDLLTWRFSIKPPGPHPFAQEGTW